MRYCDVFNRTFKRMERFVMANEQWKRLKNADKLLELNIMNVEQKEVDNEELPKTELALVEKKSLAEILVISDQQPTDFYKNTAIYQANLDLAIASAKSLVHSVDEDGRKLAKSDVALIRKFAKQNRGFALSVFKSLTDKIKSWQTSVNTKCIDLEAEADGIMARFDAMEKKKLEGIKLALKLALGDYRVESALRPEFIRPSDLSQFIKLSGTLTPKGDLTKGALTFVKAIADGEKFLQQRFDGRALTVENRCLRAGINPPLTIEGFGNEIYSDDEIFNAALDRKVAAELSRYEETKALIEKQNADDNKKKIDDALKEQQEEANRLAKIEAEKALAIENEIKSRLEITKPVVNPLQKAKQTPTPEELRASADHIEKSAQYADRNEDRNREMEAANNLRRKADEIEKANVQITAQHNGSQPVAVRPGRKTVSFTAEFEVNVSERISNRAIQDRFNSLLPPDLLAMLQNVVFHNVC